MAVQTGPDGVSWSLVVEKDGRRQPHDLPLGETLLGSGGPELGVGLRLDHPTVSRRHAALEVTADGVEVRDLGSSNGTVIDGQRLAKDQRRLVKAGQSVQFGSLTCRFETIELADTESAIELAPPGASIENSPLTTHPGETLSAPSTRDFLSQALPELISSLERQVAGDADLQAVALAAGGSIFRCFPCRRLEILDRRGPHDETVLFSAEDAASQHTDEDETPIDVSAGPLLARVLFTPGLHTRGVLPILELVLRLVALAVPESVVEPTTPSVTKPPLPTPATVDPTMLRLYDEAARVARGDVSVLIRGGTGTGKEVLARYVHQASPRRDAPLVALNCAALPQDLLEAELFGIEKGVATGVSERAGKFEMASGGTLFLDEIGDMAPATQAKILRVLEEKEVYRIGGQQARPAHVRVIAATHRDMAALVEAGDFRLDLYHRIADCRLSLPTLQERRADLPSLAGHFLSRAAEAAGVRVRGISRAALDALMAHTWPGNVRQLEREMARAALFVDDGGLLQTRHLHAEVVEIKQEPALEPRPGRSLKEQLEAFERRILEEALERHDRNVREAAKQLGMSRTTLYRRLGELAIE